MFAKTKLHSSLRQIAGRSASKGVNQICSVAVEVALLLFFTLIVLAPIHAAATRHFTVTQTIDASHATVSGNMEGIHPGQILPLYRFNYDWKSPIGNARVESVGTNDARISVDPNAMAWPLGRHGKIIREADGLYATLGTALGIGEGSYLNIFRDRKNIGRARVILAEPNRSLIQVLKDIGSTDGLVITEFIYVTQAVVFDNAFLSAIEVAALGLVLTGYVLFYALRKRSPFLLIGEKLHALPLPRSVLFWIINLLAGIPFSWFMAKMPLYLGAYLLSYASRRVFEYSGSLSPLVDFILPYAYVTVGCAYYTYLFLRRTSPVLAFWRLISYKKKSTIQKVTLRRGFFMWALHLAIVYAFGLTLIGFLKGDIQAAAAIGWHPGSPEAFFEFFKYIVWALTVVGVLIGYGYSVVSILWGAYIRNLDFTVTGWLTNGFCYPFLGIVVWQMIPAFTGPNPIITAGPLQMLMLSLGLILNVLYMLSIWNLGTMFDLMADKGVRTSGFYSVIRHPNYTLEVSMFLVTELIGLTAGIQYLAICMYLFLYWIRSEREDNFMEYSNPSYAEYQLKTPHKFIPGIY